MEHSGANLDPEFSAMAAVYKALDPLDDEARARVMAYIMSRFEISLTAKTARIGPEDSDGQREEHGAEPTATPAGALHFEMFADLFDAARPTNNSDRALVAGYWQQICLGSTEGFTGFEVNSELKHLGHAIPNITNAIGGLISQSPALALQVRKSGKSQQARKKYKLTQAGIRQVESMLNG